ncbi:hypothetical protein BFW01_g122 [Lasiodiplodia theobromae]|uniref:Uncharacterized protein n=2 Tax=Lasiodiplodia TaxID=66739 RepID=A0A5N5CU31_9PEZI|nr:uncharacterized protein LTHEOB_2803 [Lasiodiplodia theobromae]KAB2568822.1 hypothetical protein DBV05_g12506 [Lasiodiplodia theobromae]KAF4534828.1 hypothetical protein LTHEOB_2803 [Lasiodiplodia theobromae]KAF9629941.1 hypothetical protein BFW01_g122 [Lasiodiplodia theobromae]KAK0650051.1 hypothetical protein DIS24_g7168 [Lasiodiplodia hormozganensis]
MDVDDDRAASLSVSILVFKGDPLDYQRHRHTALSFRPLFHQDGPPAADSALVIHITGPPGELGFQVHDRYDATRDPGRELVRAVLVGTLRKEITKAELVQLLASVPIENSDREFNCQSWVEKGLRLLRRMEWVSEHEFEQGLDAMVECILEAEEEPEG